MKFKNILMALGLGSMLMTSCTLDEEVYTFISGVLMVSMNCW